MRWARQSRVGRDRGGDARSGRAGTDPAQWFGWGLALVLGPAFLAGDGLAANGEGVRTVQMHFRGVVHIDRGDVLSLNPPARNLMVQWLCRSGQDLARGERIVVFDTSEVQRHEALKRYDVEIARVRLERDNLRLVIRLGEIRHEKSTLESERAVVRAALDQARRRDTEQVALLRAEYDQQRLRVKELEREAALNRRRFELGELAEEKVVEMEHRITKAEADASVKRLAWEEEDEQIDTLAVAALELEEETLSMKIGRPPEGAADPASPATGLHKRIEALEAQLASTRTKNESALERARKEHHERVRDAWDHTPVRFLEVIPHGEDTPLVRIAFQPEGRDTAEGFRVDDGTPLEGDRTYGWDRDMRARLRPRDHEDPLARGVMLVREAATWHLRLEEGLYDLRIGLGDTLDWQGCMVGHGSRTLFVERHLKEAVTVEKTVAVTGGALVLRFGHPWGKAMVAPEDGAVRLQDWLYVGQRFGRNNWPIAYFTDPRKYKVEARVHQDMLAFLEIDTLPEVEAPPPEPDPEMDAILGIEEGEDGIGDEQDPLDDAVALWSGGHPTSRPAQPMDPVTRAKQSIATARVSMVDATGRTFEGVVGTIGTTAVEMTRTRPVWFRGDEKRGKDLVAREILIDVSEADAGRLQLGETVICTMRFEISGTMRVVPSHLVAEGTNRALAVSADGRRIELVGFRLGDAFVLVDGADDTGLVVPMEIDLDEVMTDRSLPGDVVAGKHQEVGISESWGRIKDLVDDGSWVEQGQQIITLYNPELENKKEAIKEARIKAQQDYLVAIETRRLKTVEAEIEHNTKVIAERQARVQIMEKEKVDSVLVARTEADLRIARAEAEREAERVEKMRAMQSTSDGELHAAAIRRDRAALRYDAAEAAHVAALRQCDWIDLLGARRTWFDAVEALALRAMALQMLRKEELVNRLAAELALHRALEGGERKRRFDRIRVVKAPVSGRLFYLTGWNDHTNSRTKIGKDFVVWGGMPIAQILDMSELGMEAEVPEDLYDEIDAATKVQVGFGQSPGQRLDAVIDRIGKAFFVPKELQDMHHGRQAVNVRRVFTLSVRFSPPPEIADGLTPGTKGFIYFP